MVKRIWEDAFKVVYHLSFKIFPVHWFWRAVWAKVTNVLKARVILRHTYPIHCNSADIGHSGRCCWKEWWFFWLSIKSCSRLVQNYKLVQFAVPWSLLQVQLLSHKVLTFCCWHQVMMHAFAWQVQRSSLLHTLMSLFTLTEVQLLCMNTTLSLGKMRIWNVKRELHTSRNTLKCRGA